MRKVKMNSEKNLLRRSARKSKTTYLLVAGNDTVPISVWRREGMRCTKCRLVGFDNVMVIFTARFTIVPSVVLP